MNQQEFKGQASSEKELNFSIFESCDYLNEFESNFYQPEQNQLNQSAYGHDFYGLFGSSPPD